jgi:hypothetical protein
MFHCYHSEYRSENEGVVIFTPKCVRLPCGITVLGGARYFQTFSKPSTNHERQPYLPVIERQKYPSWAGFNDRKHRDFPATIPPMMGFPYTETGDGFTP